jgi:hypothetical protein
VTKRDRKALCRYVRWVADVVELRDWTIVIAHDPPADDDIYAHVAPTDGRKIATVRFCAGFRDLEPDKQRMVVVHELVHLHLAPLQFQCEDDLHPLWGKAVDTVFFASFRRNIEYAVDGITHAIAKHMPLIEWPNT